MLRYVNIHNFAIIERLSISFGEGLNLLTGETGAGKSIIVDALEVLLGGRSYHNSIRSGETTSVLEAVFELPREKGRRVEEILQNVGIEISEDGEWVIRREINMNGRHRAFINDRLVTSSTIKSIQPYLLEIHGQGEHQILSAVESHLDLLDHFSRCESLRGQVDSAFSRWRTAHEALKNLDTYVRENERLASLLRFQIEEIERAAPRVGEYEELESEKHLILHAERALELSVGAYNDLYESDQSVLQQLASINRRLSELARLDDRAATALNDLETVRFTLTDIAHGLLRYSDSINFSPQRLGEIENRLSELDQLKRKYVSRVDGFDALVQEMYAQLRQLEVATARREELASEVLDAKTEYEPAALQLSVERRNAAPLLESQMVAELCEVALEDAAFVVRIESARPGSVSTNTVDDDVASGAGDHRNGSGVSFMSPHGADRAEFLFSANIGEQPRPLAKVASGGELSRLMLTLRNVCGYERNSDTGTGAETIIFDEVDTGIGGRVAEAVGRRLKSVAEKRQVLCVTHQPQIARFADHHYVVTKAVSRGRTVVSVAQLNGEERIGELARMIGGSESIEAARQTARWMLDQASQSVPHKGRKKRTQPAHPGNRC